MTETTERTQSAVRDLIGLIELAETSTQAIDRLSAALEDARAARLGHFVGFVTSFGLLLKTASSPPAVGGYSDYLLVPLFWLVIVAGIGVWRFQTRSRTIWRDLRLEFYVHDRLASLIDDASGLVGDREHLTPMAKATLDLRVKRLDRTDRRRLIER